MSTQTHHESQTHGSSCRRDWVRSGVFAPARSRIGAVLVLLLAAASASAEFALEDFTVDAAHVNPIDPHEVFFPDFNSFDLIVFGEFDITKCYKVVIHRDGGSDCGAKNSSGTADAFEVTATYIRATMSPTSQGDFKRGIDWEIEVSERRAGCTGTPRSRIHPLSLKMGGCSSTCLLEGTTLVANPSTIECGGSTQVCAEVVNSSTNLRYDWDLDGDGQFDDLTTVSPENCIDLNLTQSTQVGVLVTDQGTFEPDCLESATALVTVTGLCGDDCNGNDIVDPCDLDCGEPGGPCDVPGCGQSEDCDGNNVPDECQPDSDGDGAIDPCDGCPDDPNKTDPGVCGCGNPDIDSDGDNILDCNDDCDGDDSLIGQACDGSDADDCTSGVYDCSSGTLICTDDAELDDSDGDEIPDCQDNCVGEDSLIGQACDGSDEDECTSGVYDCSSGTLTCTDDAELDDSDGDAVPDCLDECVGDNSLIGQACDGDDSDNCASGVYDCSGGTLTCTDDAATDDSDGDAIPDCEDDCVGDDSLIGGACDGSDEDECTSGEYDCSSGTLTCTDDPGLDDSDGDAIPDCQDNCVGDDSLIGQSCDGDDADDCTSGVYDCSSGTLTCTDDSALDDSDGDAVPDCLDECVGDNSLIGQACDGDDADNCASGVYDCSVGTLSCTDDAAADDADGDSVYDCDDDCVGDNALLGTACDSGVDADACPSGVYDCSTGQIACTDDDAFDDADGDQVADCEDGCVGDDSLIGQACDGSDADECTSGVYDCFSGTLTCTDDGALDDSDGDQIPDCQDNCIGDDSLIGLPCDGSDADECTSGVYDCSSGTLTCTDDGALDDSDGDQVPDCLDECVGDNSLIGQSCDGDDADNCTSGQYDCSSGTLTCTDDGVLDDADGDAIPDCQDNCVGDDSLVGQACDGDDADNCASGVYSCSSGALSCTDDAATDDADGDTIPDCQDNCVGDDSLIGQACDGDDIDDCASGVYDCSGGTLFCTDDAATDDGDGDSVYDCDDNCVGDNALLGTECDSDVDMDACPSGIYDCSTGQVVCTDDDLFDDVDGDQVADCEDECPDTLPGQSVGVTGCSCPQADERGGPGGVQDTDGDGVPDLCDNCPGTPNADQLNSDDDPIGDACDLCDGDDRLIGQRCDSEVDADSCSSGVYDCSSGTLTCTDDDALDDADGDAVPDCEDGCIGDNSLIGQSCDGTDADDCASGEYDCSSGTLTCTDDSVLDDADGDAIPDCQDNCVGDDSLIGQACDGNDSDACASGVYDCSLGTLTCTDDAAPDDSDGDQIPDCVDDCVGDDSLIGQVCDGVDADECASGEYDCLSGTLTCTDDSAPDDSDGDGVPDCLDECIGDNSLIGQACDGDDADDCASGEYDCSSGTLTCTDDAATDDSDGDGVADCHDECVGDDSLIGQACDGDDTDDCASGEYDCSSGTLSCTDDAETDDADGDQVPDCVDNCVGDDSLIGQACDGSDADECASGVYECSSGALTCTDDTALDDSDGDAVPDCVDECIGDDSLIGQACDGDDADDCASGVYDCSSGTITCTDDAALDDSDGDGIADCHDDCVGDDSLIGQACDGDDADDCASGVYDCSSGSLTCTDDAATDDSDGDGIADCHDECVGDDSLIGQACDGDDADECESGVYDCSSGTLTCTDDAATDDSDGDAVPDCVDDCVGDESLIGQSCDGDDADDCASGEYECSSGTLTCTDDAATDDSDGDGIADCHDDCIGDDSLIGRACDGDDADDCASGVYDCSSGTLTCTDDAATDDSDGDGIADCHDDCVGDDSLIGQACDGDDADDCASGVYDCSSGTLTCTDDAATDDSDGDGIADCHDECVGDNSLIGQACDGDDADDCASGVYDCSSGTLSCTDDSAFDDSDGDGIPDCQDECIGDNSLIGQACDGDDTDDCATGEYDCSSGTLTCTDDAAQDDADGDAVPDCLDACVGDDSLIGDPCDSDIDTDDCASGVYECSLGLLTCTDDADDDDADGDGVDDCVDQCTGDDALLGQECDSTVDSDGCLTGVYECVAGTVACTDDDAVDDSDGDQVSDCEDDCPQTPADQTVGVTGCSCDQIFERGLRTIEDVDGDGIPDLCDNCPDTANADQSDGDGDGIGNACDACEGDDALIGLPCDNVEDNDACESGLYDCSSGTLSCTDDAAFDDADGDDIPDCEDGCPNDPAKTDPGPCGCGVPDTDSDGDETADCNEVLLECPTVQVVFVMDTSGSMKDEASALCSSIDTILSDLASLGVPTTAELLGIMQTPGFGFSCLTGDVAGMLGTSVPSDPECCPALDSNEDWATATAIVAERYPWIPGAVRIVVPIGDEGPNNGDPCNDPGDDRAAIDNAIITANAHGVFLAPITGTGSSACVEGLAYDLARGTGGTTFGSTDPSSDLATAIQAIVVDICVNGDDAVREGVQPIADSCPDDPGKLAPGVCGCGVPDTDADRDGIMDCLETEPGERPASLEAMCGNCGAVGMTFYPLAMMGYAMLLFGRRRTRRLG